MTGEQVVDFWRYDYCPRGAGDRKAHEAKMLRHVILGGRRCCADVELVERAVG